MIYSSQLEIECITTIVVFGANECDFFRFKKHTVHSGHLTGHFLNNLWTNYASLAQCVSVKSHEIGRFEHEMAKNKVWKLESTSKWFKRDLKTQSFEEQSSVVGISFDEFLVWEEVNAHEMS